MKILLKIAVVVIFITTHPLQAQSYSDSFYYSIGGGQLSDESLNNWNTFSINLDAYAGTKYSCGDFDLGESLKQLVKDLGDIPDEFQEYLKVAIYDYLKSLIALSIQKASPGVYEYLNNSFLRHKEYLEVRLATCKRVEEMLAGGELNDLADFAKLVEWRRAAETGETIQDAEKNNSVENGVPWVDGQLRGGAGQEPIHLVADTIEKGYASLASSAGGTAQNSPIKRYFPSGNDATVWAVEVFGEKNISLVDQSTSSTGSGLSTQIAKSTDEIKTLLNSMVSAPASATQADIEKISTPNYLITFPALSAINARPKDQQIVLKARLASELATLQNIEKAYIVRDLITSGMHDPNIYFSTLKEGHYDYLVAQIDNEISSARMKASLRKELVGDLLVKTFQSRDDGEMQPSNLPGKTAPREKLPSGGVIAR